MEIDQIKQMRIMLSNLERGISDALEFSKSQQQNLEKDLIIVREQNTKLLDDISILKRELEIANAK